MKKFFYITCFIFFFIGIINQNSAQNWTQIGNDINGTQQEERLGEAVSINDDGTIVAMGAKYYNDLDSNNVGRVRIFEDDGGNWIQKGNDIVGTYLDERLGWDVSLNGEGDRIAVAASAVGNTSYIKILHYDNGAWNILGDTIFAEEENESGGHVSASLNRNGDIVAFGYPGTVDAGLNKGQVRLFQFDASGNSWDQIGNKIEGVANLNLFGEDVDINANGDRFVSGAHQNSDSDNLAGHVRVFDFDGTNWVQVGNTLYGDAANDMAGVSVSIGAEGDEIAFGSTANYVKAFIYDGSSWVQRGQNINGDDAGDFFGSHLSSSRDLDILAVGAHNNDNNGFNAGQVKVYEYQSSNNTWIQLGGDIYGDDPSDLAGWDVDINLDGDVVALGASGNEVGSDGSVGQVKVFEYDFATGFPGKTENPSKINIFPNFIQSVVFIKSNEIIKNVYLYDMNGRIVLTENVESLSANINVDDLHAGIYFIRIKTINDVKTQKLKILN